jgi:hypothetical protein
MAAVNYYLGLKRGAEFKKDLVVAGTTTSGTAVDVEVRLQINDGSNDTNLTRLDSVLILEIIEAFIEAGGLNAAGANLPVL